MKKILFALCLLPLLCNSCSSSNEEDILPQERLAMTIKRIDDDRREFILKPIGKKYEELVKEIEYENNCHG